MKIYSLIRKGEGHQVFCEDFLLINTLNNQFLWGAIADGCSSGKDSHFASAFLLKLLRKNAQEVLLKADNKEDDELLGMNAKKILLLTFQDMKDLKKQMVLQTEEMLATLLFFIYDFVHNRLWAIVVGDGLFYVDGIWHEVDQNNQPDYWAYHLKEDFEDWFKKQKNIYEIPAPKKFAIASDGIFSFQGARSPEEQKIAPASYFLEDEQFLAQPNMLGRKFNILYSQHGLQPYDDVSIVLVKTT